MRRHGNSAIAIAILLLWAAPLARSQAQPRWTLRVQQGQDIQNLVDGGTIAMNAPAVGTASTAVLNLTYKGTLTANITSVDFTGSLDFSWLGVPDPTVSILPSSGFGVSIRFLPSTSAKVSGKLVIYYTEGTTIVPITVNLAGTAPEFAFSYTPQGGNATLLAPGGTIGLPAVAIDSVASAMVTLVNRGSGPGVVNSISSTGPGFQLVGLPLPATTVDAGKDLKFTVSFTPKQLETAAGTLAIEFVDRTVSFNLGGSGLGAVFAYEVTSESTVSALLPGQLIALPDVAVGSISSVIVRVRNTGNAPGILGAISAVGAGYQITDLPFLPLTLQAGGATQFSISFTPAQAGRTTARLRIGSDMFDIAGTGLAALMAYYVEAGGVQTQVQNNGSVIFQPVAVGGATSVRFLIANNGTSPSSVTNISIGATVTPFTLSELPAFPVTVGPSATVSIVVTFKPVASGSATATLKVDALSFTLSASANPPAALPDYRFEKPAGAIDAVQQPAIGLTLASAYPLALTGTLTLTFNSDVFSNDPAIQFATGSRTVNFNIPAGSTRAVFQNNDTQIRLQTGTVAGTINLTPSFVTVDGGLNLTPTNPLALNLTVPQSAPRLMSVQVSAKTSIGFTLQLTGYATSRSVTQMDFTFTALAGENVGTTKLTLPAEASFLAWYQNAQSQPYGSLFTATVPFTLSGDVKNVTQVVETIQSVSATITNRQGTSSAVSVNLK